MTSYAVIQGKWATVPFSVSGSLETSLLLLHRMIISLAVLLRNLAIEVPTILCYFFCRTLICVAIGGKSSLPFSIDHTQMIKASSMISTNPTYLLHESKVGKLRIKR
jgi:hypothetical protein